MFPKSIISLSCGFFFFFFLFSSLSLLYTHAHTHTYTYEYLSPSGTALQELMNFRSRAVEHIESQSSLIAVLTSRIKNRSESLLNMQEQVSLLRSELESLRRPAIELRRFSSEIRAGLKSALKSRSEQAKREVSLRKAYRQCKNTLRHLMRPGITRSCWISEESSTKMPSSKQLTIVSNTTNCCVLAIKNNTRHVNHFFDTVHGPSASKNEDVFQFSNDLSVAALNGLNATAILIDAVHRDENEASISKILGRVFEIQPPKPCRLTCRLCVATIWNDTMYDMLTTSSDFSDLSVESKTQLMEVEVARASDVDIVLGMAFRRQKSIVRSKGWSQGVRMGRMSSYEI